MGCPRERPRPTRYRLGAAPTARSWCPSSTSTSSAWSTTRVARCSSSPVPAPARPRRWSRRSSTASSTAAPRPTRCSRSPSPARPPSSCATGSPRASARTTSAAACSTFHSFAYALVRKYAPAELYEGAIRLLSAPEADVVLRELLRDNPESVVWPEQLRRAVGTRGFVREVQAVLARAREKGLDPAGLRALGIEHDLPELVAGRAVPRAVPHGPRQPRRHRLRRPDPPRGHRGRGPPRRAAGALRRTSSSTSTRTPTPARSRCCARSPATVATSPWWATRTSRSTASAAPTCAASSTSRRSFPTAARRARARSSCCGAPAGSGRGILLAAGRVAGRLTLTGSIAAEAREAFLSPEAVPGPQGDGRVEVVTYDTERAEAERLADLLRRAHLEDGIAWDRMAVLVRSGRTSIPPLRRALAAAGVPVEVASDDLPLVRDPAVLPLLDALRAVVNLDNDDPDSPDFLDPGRIESLLLSPLGGLDASDLRALVRRLRTREKELPDATARRTSPRAAAARRGRARASSTASRVPTSSAPLPWPRCCARGARMLAERAGVEDVLWHLWSEHVLAAAAAPPGRPRRSGRPPRPPRPRRDRRALRARLPRGRPARPRRRRRVLRQPRRPAAARRHPRRAGRPRRGGPAAHRPPLQGPRVGPRRRRPRPAGGLARPAPPHDAARRRPDRRRRRPATPTSSRRSPPARC